MTREQMTVEDAGCREHRGKGNVYGDGQSQSQPRFDDPEQNKMSRQIQQSNFDLLFVQLKEDSWTAEVQKRHQAQKN